MSISILLKGVALPCIHSSSLIKPHFLQKKFFVVFSPHSSQTLKIVSLLHLPQWNKESISRGKLCPSRIAKPHGEKQESPILFLSRMSFIGSLPKESPNGSEITLPRWTKLRQSTLIRSFLPPRQWPPLPTFWWFCRIKKAFI